MRSEPISVQSDRTIALVAYGLHLFGAIAGITSIAGLILNYFSRDQYDEALASHHRWMIRSFWWALFWIVIGIVTWFFLIGMAICGLTWLWYVYRHVRGLVALVNGDSLPA
jgi:uncharacterized membrane protein